MRNIVCQIFEEARFRLNTKRDADVDKLTLLTVYEAVLKRHGILSKNDTEIFHEMIDYFSRVEALESSCFKSTHRYSNE